MLYKKSIQTISLGLFLGFMACTNTPESTQKDEAKNTDTEASAKDGNVIPASNDKSKSRETAGDEKAGITFESTEFNFGEIRAGEKVKYKFKFKSSGKAPLVIESASPSCGCTVPDYPKQPIQPNETGEIAIEFDSAGKDGKQDKTVTVKSNAETPSIVLNIRGYVKGKVDMNGPLLNPKK